MKKISRRTFLSTMAAVSAAGVLAACGVLFCSIPTMIVFFVLQKQFAEGITGSVK